MAHKKDYKPEDIMCHNFFSFRFQDVAEQA